VNDISILSKIDWLYAKDMNMLATTIDHIRAVIEERENSN
jgi:hypothetical protein